MEKIAGTFPTPYYAVIFISQKSTDDPAFEKMQKVIAEKIRAAKGFLGMDSSRSPEGLGFSISYWDSLESIKAWRDDETHSAAQGQAREKWYSQYTIRTCKVEYDSVFTQDAPGKQVDDEQ